jgi:hypothetical protein
MFYGPLDKFQIDIIVWNWANQEKLMKDTTKHTRKMFNLINNLSITLLNYANLTFHQISKCGGRIF